MEVPRYMYSQFIVELSCFDCVMLRKSAAGLCHKMSGYMKKIIRNFWKFWNSHGQNLPLRLKNVYNTTGITEGGLFTIKIVTRILKFSPS